LSDRDTEATAAFAFVTAILQELDSKHAGFAEAVFARIEQEIEQSDDVRNPAILAHHDELVEGLELVRASMKEISTKGPPYTPFWD
jgi:hypothetical protein